MKDRKEIQHNKFSVVERVDFNEGQYCVKSFNWKNLNLSLEHFINEIVTFQIIQSKDKDASLLEAKETLKCSYIAEYVGFMLYDSADPFCASIVIKWYPIGDLSQYTRNVSDPEWFFKPNESTEEHENSKFVTLAETKREQMPKEIVQLLRLARQIAEGYIFNHIFMTEKVSFPKLDSKLLNLTDTFTPKKIWV